MGDGKSKSEFWWASIAGADCEPVEVVKVHGKRVAYTCGCGDPFELDTPDSLVVLIGGEPERRPLTPAQAEAEQIAQDAAIDRAIKNGTHRWRGPR